MHGPAPVHRVLPVSLPAAAPQPSAAVPLIVRRLGLVPYVPAWARMREFTATRGADTPDELWLLEHPPVYTAGIAGKPEHWPRIDNGIPVIRVDRGGQITYHGPGQLVAYLLLDMRRRGISVRPLVRQMEQAVINLLAGYGIAAHGRPDAPGVYVGPAKIAALGLRVRNGCCYHGLALNVDVALAPFAAINPCGYPGLEVTRTRDLGITDTRRQLGEKLIRHIRTLLQ
ncbi:MAG: lipoyl(octanoyl) transferase LipB [Burkholderiales bacterium]|nr:lipoyl(octanoyl) transferase LipB [Burkholderiales bacterium]